MGAGGEASGGWASMGGGMSSGDAYTESSSRDYGTSSGGWMQSSSQMQGGVGGSAAWRPSQQHSLPFNLFVSIVRSSPLSPFSILLGLLEIYNPSPFPSPSSQSHFRCYLVDEAANFQYLCSFKCLNDYSQFLCRCVFYLTVNKVDWDSYAELACR